MKTFALILICLMVLFETLAFAVFHYPKSGAWWIGNVILFILNFMGVLLVENNDEIPPPGWKVYVPIALIIAFIILIVLPQASTFNQ